MLDKTPKSTAKIRFQDCDPYNHLNNAKYIDYMINAREDHVLEAYQLDIFQYAKKHKRAWVVATNQVAYLAPVFTMDVVSIDSQLLYFSDKSVKVEIRMWDETYSQLKALMWVTFVHFDFKTQTAVSHLPEHTTLFEQIVYPVEQKTFEERFMFFRQSAKS